MCGIVLFTTEGLLTGCPTVLQGLSWGIASPLHHMLVYLDLLGIFKKKLDSQVMAILGKFSSSDLPSLGRLWRGLVNKGTPSLLVYYRDFCRGIIRTGVLNMPFIPYMMGCFVSMYARVLESRKDKWLMDISPTLSTLWSTAWMSYKYIYQSSWVSVDEGWGRWHFVQHPSSIWWS